MKESVRALAICHNVTPSGNSDDGDDGSSNGLDNQGNFVCFVRATALCKVYTGLTVFISGKELDQPNLYIVFLISE